MKILYISQYFPPEAGATQSRALEMVRYLAGQGHEVTVLCNLPNHPSGIIAPGYRHRWQVVEKWQGVRVVRTWVFTRPRKNLLVRAFFYLSFMISSFWAGWRMERHFDVVFATSPPPLTGVTGWLLSRMKGAAFVYEVRDLWREMACQLGALENPLWIWLGQHLDRFLYRRASRLICVTQGIQDALIRQGWGEKTHLIRNGANTEPFSDCGQDVRKELGWNGKFVVLYAGVWGLAQGMENLCALAERCLTDSRFQFVFAGTGPMAATVKRLQQERRLLNLMLLGEIPRDKMAGVISAADCGLVPLKDKPLFRGAVPTKMFDFWACRRPVVVSVDGEARQILEESRAGIYVAPEDVAGMAAAIRYLCENPHHCRAMGRAGRHYVKARFSRRRAAAQLEAVLLALVAKTPGNQK